MKDLVDKYQWRMGWNDASVISILLDYICYCEKKHIPLEKYLEERACEEELE